MSENVLCIAGPAQLPKGRGAAVLTDLQAWCLARSKSQLAHDLSWLSNPFTISGGIHTSMYYSSAKINPFCFFLLCLNFSTASAAMLTLKRVRLSFLGLPQWSITNRVTWNKSRVFSHGSGDQKSEIKAQALWRICFHLSPSFRSLLAVLGLQLHTIQLLPVFPWRPSLCVFSPFPLS